MKEVNLREIAESSTGYDKERHRIEKIFPEQHGHVYMIKALGIFLCCGAFLTAKVNLDWEILEWNAFHSSDCRYMPDLVLYILSQDKAWVMQLF